MKISQEYAEQQFCKADKLSDEGKYKEALGVCLALARQGGDRLVALNIGVLYELVEGLEKAFSKSLYWYKRAWKLENGCRFPACGNIAVLYSQVGNRRRAMFWWKKAIELDDGCATVDCAKFMLGSRKCDLKKTMALLVKATKSLHVCLASVEEASFLLAMLFSQMGDRRRSQFWLDKAIALDGGDAIVDCAKFMLRTKHGCDIKKMKTLLLKATESSNISSIVFQEVTCFLESILADESKKVGGANEEAHYLKLSK